MNMKRYGMILMAVVLLVMAMPAVTMAQDGVPTSTTTRTETTATSQPVPTETFSEDATGALLTLTLEETITIIVSGVASLIAVMSAVVVWLKLPSDERNLSALDQTVAGRIDAIAENAATMAAVEKIVDSLNTNHRASLKESGELVLRAAQWIPGQSSNALADIYTEATDGVPFGEKFEEETDDKPDDTTKELPSAEADAGFSVG